MLLSMCAAEDNSGKKSVSSDTSSGPIPVFALRGSDTGDSISIDQILLIDGGKLHAVPDPCSDSSASHAFDERYFKPGTEYPVIFGGRPKGTVVVKKPEAMDYPVEPHTDAPIKGFTMALAVGSKTLGRESGVRRNPTPAEQTHLEQLAKEIFTSKGVPASSLARMVVDQIAVVDLNHASRIVASIAIERQDKLGPDYNLFVIADPVTGEHSVLWFQHPTKETEGEGLSLIDVLDFDKSGKDRLFVRRALYENYHYEVYGSAQGRWVKEFTSQTFGCL